MHCIVIIPRRWFIFAANIIHSDFTVVEYNILPVPIFYHLHCVVKYLRKNRTSSLKEEIYTNYYPSAQEFWLFNSLCVPLTRFTKCEIAKFNSTQNALYVEINIKKWYNTSFSSSAISSLDSSICLKGGSSSPSSIDGKITFPSSLLVKLQECSMCYYKLSTLQCNYRWQGYPVKMPSKDDRNIFRLLYWSNTNKEHYLLFKMQSLCLF